MAVTGYGSVDRPYAESPWERIVEVHWGGAVALVTILQSELSEWNLQSTDPVRLEDWTEPPPQGVLVPFDQSIDPEYTDGHSNYNPGIGIIPKSQYLKDSKATPFNSGTCIYFASSKRLPPEGGGDGLVRADQYAWLDTGNTGGFYFIGVHGAGPGSIEYYESQLHFLNESPYNGVPSQIELDGEFSSYTFTGQTRVISTGEYSPGPGIIGQGQVGQAKFKILPAESAGSPQKRYDYFLVNFSGSLAEDGTTKVSEKTVAVVFPPGISDPATPLGDITYEIVVNDWTTPAQVILIGESLGDPTPLPFPFGFDVGQSRYISSTDIIETKSFSRPPFSGDQSATVRVQIYPPKTKFNIDEDGTVTAVPDPDDPDHTVPHARYDETHALPYPAPGGSGGDPAIVGVKFNAKGFI